MRKHQQRQILELLETIREAQEAELWPDCQACAITAGEFIESLEGEGTQTVALLEEYCDLLYEAHAGEQRGRALRKALISIENSVRQELKPDRVEMAFLSYKAAMSDSLESIYLAAKADPSCDAYWIPIPYIERNTDQVTGIERYEGAEYYDSRFECTWWEDYDIEQRHPDVVFTFYPYDEDNFLTGLHPEHQCERLRNLTEMLVYIPYFVVANTAGILEEYCTTSGCMFAHKVILQSEEVRRFYIKSFRKLYGNSFGKPEDKFVALGSPKFDKVINTKRENCVLPEEWARLISGKKVVLYNTSVTAQLLHEEAYLLKLRTVFTTFRARGDVVVWWRPHPLAERTYATMRPRLADLYRTIVAQYRAEGWGIYDDTPDLHRAIAWTDAYYGDWSSLVALYAVTKKPILTQKMLPQKHEEYFLDRLALSFIYETKEALWASASNCNALYRIDKQTLRAEYIGSFPDEDALAANLYLDAVECGRQLFFAPYTAKHIYIFDIDNSSFQTIKTPLVKPDSNTKIAYDEKRKFTSVVQTGSRIFCIPGTYPGILVYDPSTKTFQVIDNWIKQIMPFTNKTVRFWLSKCIMNNERLVFACSSANALLELDLQTYETVAYRLNADEIGYIDIVSVGEEYWLLARNKAALIRYNKKTSEHREYTVLLDGVSTNEDYQFQSVFHIDGSLLLTPFFCSEMVCFDLCDASFSFVESFMLEEWENEDGTTISDKVFEFFRTHSERFIYLFTANRRLIEFNPATFQMRETGISCKEGKNRVALKNHLREVLDERLHNAVSASGDCFYEDGEYITVEALADALTSPKPLSWLRLRCEKQRTSFSNTVGFPDGKAGRRIYNYCKEVLLWS